MGPQTQLHSHKAAIGPLLGEQQVANCSAENHVDLAKGFYSPVRNLFISHVIEILIKSSFKKKVVDSPLMRTVVPAVHPFLTAPTNRLTLCTPTHAVHNRTMRAPLSTKRKQTVPRTAYCQSVPVILTRESPATVANNKYINKCVSTVKLRVKVAL